MELDFVSLEGNAVSSSEFMGLVYLWAAFFFLNVQCHVPALLED